MAVRFDLLECPVSYRGASFIAVTHTGSSLNLMSMTQAKKLGMVHEIRESQLFFKVADGSVSEAHGELSDVPLTFGDLTFLLTFAVLEECCHDLLIGTSYLQETSTRIEFEAGGALSSLTDGNRRVELPVTCSC